jgi:hypothetical protein
MTLYANDPDVHEVYPITDRLGVNLTFTPIIQIRGAGGPPDITGAWLGEPAPSRDLKVPLTGLRPGATYTLRLVVPGDRDIDLGTVTLT